MKITFEISQEELVNSIPNIVQHFEGQQPTVNEIEKIFNELRKMDSWYEDEDDEDDEECGCSDCVAERNDMEKQEERIINELKHYIVDNQARDKWAAMEKERQHAINATQTPPCLTPQAIGNALSKGESLQDNLDKYRMQCDIAVLLAEIKKLNSQDKQ